MSAEKNQDTLAPLQDLLNKKADEALSLELDKLFAPIHAMCEDDYFYPADGNLKIIGFKPDKTYKSVALANLINDVMDLLEESLKYKARAEYTELFVKKVDDAKLAPKN